MKSLCCPRFRCQRCGETWTCGKDGGDYLAAAKKPRAVVAKKPRAVR